MADDASEFFECARLGLQIELTAERRRHIERSHAAEAAAILQALPGTVEDPEVVLESGDEPGVYLLARSIEMPTGAKHIVAIIVSDAGLSRRWIVTAFVTRRLGRGDRWNAI